MQLFPSPKYSQQQDSLNGTKARHKKPLGPLQKVFTAEIELALPVVLRTLHQPLRNKLAHKGITQKAPDVYFREIWLMVPGGLVQTKGA